MSLEKEIENINLFLATAQSIFVFSELDFPNQTQQTSIIGYIYVEKILHSSNQVQKDFQQLSFKNPTNLRNIVVGLLYKSILFPHQQQTLFNYIRQLRSQALDIYSNFFMKFLIQQIDKINDDALMTIPIIYHQLVKYNILVESLTTAIIRSINFIDLSERALTYTNNLIEVLLQTVQIIQMKSKQGGGVARLIFIKVLRLLTSINYIEQNGQMIEFKTKCQQLIISLWKINKTECLNCGIQSFRYFQQLLSNPSINAIFEQYRQQYYSNEKILATLPKQKNDQLLATIIPISIFEAIIFSLNSTNSQIYYQMNWFQKDNIENKNYEMLLVDILRYMVRIVHHPNKFVFIEWILSYSQRRQTSIIFKPLCLQAMFFDWFFNQNLDETQLLDITKGGLMILGMCQQQNIQKCQQMVEFIIYQLRKQYNIPSVKQNFRRIFKIAQDKGFFKISEFMSNNRVDTSLKEQLRNLISGKSVDYSEKQYEVSNLLRIQSHQSDNIWGKEPSEISIEPNFTQQQIQQQVDGIFINIQKHYYEQNQINLNQLFEFPTKLNYESFLQNFILVVKKVYSDSQIYQKFIQQTVKVSYIMFQSHWQTFSKINNLSPQNNIISIHVNQLLKSWGTSNVILDFHKKFIKCMIKTFPITSFSFYFTFLIIVPSTKVNCQQISKFLLGENKTIIERVLTKFINDRTITDDIKTKGNKYKLNIQ